MRVVQLGVLGLVLGFSSCGALREYVVDQATQIAKDEVAKASLALAAKYVPAEELAKWKAAADTDKSGDVSSNEWWIWLKENWFLGVGAALFEYLRRRNKSTKGQLYAELKEVKKAVSSGSGPTS